MMYKRISAQSVNTETQQNRCRLSSQNDLSHFTAKTIPEGIEPSDPYYNESSVELISRRQLTLESKRVQKVEEKKINS